MTNTYAHNWASWIGEESDGLGARDPRVCQRRVPWN
jgi:hypothetical protein